MTPDKREMQAALDIRHSAASAAWLNHPLGSPDVEAAAAAILCRALELATPDLSPKARARLFLSDELPPSSLEQEYDLATYGDWMSDENQ